MHGTGPERSFPERPRRVVDVPVLLVVFNRPQKVRRMVDALREARPQRIFVAADGPRPQFDDDTERCGASRRALDAIDWPCEVRTLFQAENLGCKRGPETAITWFFSQVDHGVILEDDCVPTPDFFPFCAELLDRFRDGDKIMMIGGFNPLGSWPAGESSYLTSRTSPTWGWATWARAWRHYDPAMTAWQTAAARRAVRARMSATEYVLTRRRFDRVCTGETAAWDFAWSFTMLRRGGLSILPVENMVSNIGFGPDATHTRNPWSADARVPLGEMRFPLRHPEQLEPSPEFEKALWKSRYPLARRLLTLLPSSVADRVRAVLFAGPWRRLARGERPGPAGVPAGDRPRRHPQAEASRLALHEE